MEEDSPTKAAKVAKSSFDASEYFEEAYRTLAVREQKQK